MKKIIFYLFCFTSYFVYSQTDYSASWEDFYSYNNVKSIEKVDNIIYALADNAVFTYDVTTEEISKISSVNGLSGETTTAFHYSENFEKLIIGYENGLIEVLNNNGSVTVSSDIANFTQAGDKKINSITEFGENLLLSTPFAIIEYNIDREEFGDTFFIGNNSTEVKTNQTIVFDNLIYAVTENGLFIADATSNLLIDFNNWNQLFAGRNFTGIIVFNNEIYVSEGRNLFKLSNNSLELEENFNQNIQALKASENNITIALNSSAVVLDDSLNRISEFTNTSDFEFSLNTAIFENNTVYLATNEYGVLIPETNQSSFIEIHPDGPLSNEMFSITSTNQNLWIAYGGYNVSFVPNSRRGRYSNFNGESWTNIEFDRNEMPFLDFVDVTVDPENESRIFVSSFAQTGNGNLFSGGGLLELIDNELSFFYNSTNSPLSDFQESQNQITTRVSGTVFDSNNNLWVTDALGIEKLKKLDANGNWTSIDLSSVQVADTEETGMITIDSNNTLWIATRRSGIYVYNENGDRKRGFDIFENLGNLPNLGVRTIAIDANNRVWIGTREGLVVYNNALNVFDDNFLNAQPIIIEVNGLGERLLGEQIINTIAIDGADNKWFGVDNGGVLYTNPNGQNTLASFTTENSPLPSNRILKIAVNTQTGKVFFLTDKGLVAYNSNVSPFGETLGEVYAYPNPALKQHQTVTIDGRNGTNLPKGTNVKIVDITGNLVYETNVVEGQELQGGKVVWNKKNLAGKKVASGVYIVLLSNEDASQNSITKIAIVN
jgi:ligand-binding sensor domain-containing protein